MKTFWVIAHRGASARAPENTRAAFEEAVRLAATAIETDVRCTRDGALILLHDPWLDRATDGHGPVDDWTLEELRQLDAGSWFAPRFAGEPLLTLQEALDEFARHVPFVLEVKDDRAVEPLVACLQRGGWLDRVQVTSFAWHHLLAVRALEPRLTVGYLTPYLSLPLLERMARRGFHQVCPPAELVTPRWVEAAHALGLRVRAYGVHTPEAARRVVASGADGMTVDDPLWGLTALAEAGGTPVSSDGWVAEAWAVQLHSRRNRW